MEQYPTERDIAKAVQGFNVVEVIYFKAIEIGDPTGKIANVVMIGVMSRLAPI
jgi:indolepyruvate ferredoxin oxidoreductase alpha subunit